MTCILTYIPLVNPKIGEAGYSVGKSDIRVVERLCAKFPYQKFLVTMLSRENQHELAATARKFRNLHIFGCWWFLNNPVLIEEMTRMRIELLGASFTLQHSDSRVLEQLLYKWDHTRKIVRRILLEKYQPVIDSGWIVTEDEIRRDVRLWFGDSFKAFLRSRIS